ncbi:hypothetical protein CFOL_v3_09910 [Cephalotus follicularis]|uniref:Transmembrane protein n=1 Tax=Cephalotus follicularis TaxID=3775 RepID=A0A1Q3BEH3_CEPFO|nr:hypothetical protein CFOL_v3_09910 [Cephalotus follicularis]
MIAKASFLLFLYTSTILSIARAQERAPHGLANENPVAFSPSAVEFFHPKTEDPDVSNQCATSYCSPLPLAAQVEATQAYESKVATSQKGKSGIGAGSIAGIVSGLAFVVLLTMSVYYVVINRRENASRAISVQPDA